jgi:hypothetical protein
MNEIESDLPAAALSTLGRPQAALRKKIGWICQFIRAMAIAWIAWLLYVVVAFWSDREKVVNAYLKSLKINPSELPDFSYHAAFGVALFDWALTALVVASLWRLLSIYIAGNVFTVEASLALRRVALLGGLAKAFDLLARPLVFALLTAGHDAGGQHGLFFAPNDLLEAIYIAFLFSLATIFKSAAELAEEHAQIV